MLSRNKNRFAYMAASKEHGFTLMDTILTFMIVVVTMPFLVYLIQYIQVQKADGDIEVLHLFIFLRDDMMRAETVSTHDDVLYFHLATGETAKIEHFHDVIRRRVDGTGHEIYARNIQTFHLTPLS